MPTPNYHSTITRNRSILIEISSPNSFLPFYNYHKSNVADKKVVTELISPIIQLQQIDKFCLTFKNPVLFSILHLTTICNPLLSLYFSNCTIYLNLSLSFPNYTLFSNNSLTFPFPALLLLLPTFPFPSLLPYPPIFQSSPQFPSSTFFFQTPTYFPIKALLFYSMPYFCYFQFFQFHP